MQGSEQHEHTDVWVQSGSGVSVGDFTVEVIRTKTGEVKLRLHHRPSADIQRIAKVDELEN